jgi:chitodextrinase
MSTRKLSKLSVVALLIVVMVLALAISPASAAADRKPPTTPTNLRVTGMTPYSVSLAWNPSTDNSRSVSYSICCANVNSETFPGPASTHVYRAGLTPGYTFTLRIVAFDAAGNYSKYSNSVTFTLPRDFTPPAKPTISVTDVGASYVSLAWSVVDEDPNIRFLVTMNGSTVVGGDSTTSGTFPASPETTYTFTAQARDSGGNFSPVSDPVTVTTEASDPNDTTPPTTPANFRDNGMSFQDGETWLFWDPSTDNVDPQFAIRYEVYVNGVLDSTLMGYTRQIVYGNPGVFNTFQVIAMDSAGNRSAPATLTTCAGGLGC